MLVCYTSYWCYCHLKLQQQIRIERSQNQEIMPMYNVQRVLFSYNDHRYPFCAFLIFPQIINFLLFFWWTQQFANPQDRNKVLFPHIQSKSIGDAIYSSNWTIATSRERRALLFVMIISQKGLKLSYYGIFGLALDTFTWVNLSS